MPNSAVDRLSFSLQVLRKRSSNATLQGLARYNIPTEGALGVAMRDVQAIAKTLGRDHDLALALWSSGIYEARLLAAYVDDPALVTPAQMDRWCRDFDNWGVTDTVCFVLFDRTPHAWTKVEAWGKRREEFVKRAGFALLWALTVHDKSSGDAPFRRGLALVERGAADDRPLVMKGIDMALRAVGKRNVALNDAAADVARRLTRSPDKSAQWIGRHALKEIEKTRPRR